MARPLRLEFAGSLYHPTAPVNLPLVEVAKRCGVSASRVAHLTHVESHNPETVLQRLLVE